MNRLKICLFILLFFGLGISGASATLIDLYDWAFNLNGTVYRAPDIYSKPDPGQLPASIDDSAFDWSDGYQDGGGLGIITVTYAPGAAGDFSVIAFFDHEIDEAVNTYFNEGGSANGSPAAGQSWEIDDPFFGDIIGNVYSPPLDDSNNALGPWDDVSMAIGWDFTFANVGDKAIINLVLDTTAPASGFYLEHTDPLSNASIFFSSSLEIQPIPEPGTIFLVGTGLAGLAGWRRKRSKN